MRDWQHRIKIRHLLVYGKEDHASIQESMNAIADAIAPDPWFRKFQKLSKFREVPVGDDVIPPADYANALLDKLYDFCDDNSIWVE